MHRRSINQSNYNSGQCNTPGVAFEKNINMLVFGKPSRSKVNGKININGR